MTQSEALQSRAVNSQLTAVIVLALIDCGPRPVSSDDLPRIVVCLGDTSTTLSILHYAGMAKRWRCKLRDKALSNASPPAKHPSRRCLVDVGATDIDADAMSGQCWLQSIDGN